MKTIDAGLRAHLDQEVTSVCTCWTITRKDGKVYRFTDADTDVKVRGNTYVAVGAYSRTAIESTAELSVDNLEITGITTPIALPVEELRAGAFDYASVEIFMVSWEFPETGTMALRQGFFGEVRVLPNGTFEVDLRGLMQKLAHNYTDMYSTTCRHALGDSGCKINLAHPFLTTGSHVPLTIADSDFEEVGAKTIFASGSWYDPTNSGEALTLAEAYTGRYAGCVRGTGKLQQDIPLAEITPDFLDAIDKSRISFKISGWRKDSGLPGRMRITFLNDALQPVRTARYARIQRSLVTLPGARVLGAGDLTVEYWMKRSHEFPADYVLMGHDFNGTFPNASANGDHFVRFQTGSSGYRRVLGMYFGSRVTNVTNWTTQFLPFQQLTKVDDGNWHHIAITRTGAIWTLFVNGRQEGQVTAPLRWAEIPMSVRNLGTQETTTRYTWWDEIRIWDVALPQWRIARDRVQDIAPASPNLLNYFSFEEGLNDVAGGSGGGNLSVAQVTYFADGAPARVALRGADLSPDIPYSREGNGDWYHFTHQHAIPPHTRHLRITFEANTDTMPADWQRCLIDSLYGYFMDSAGTERMPNMSDSSAAWTRAGMVTSAFDKRSFNCVVQEDRAISGWFNGGLVVFYSGRNKGAAMEVKSWTSSGDGNGGGGSQPTPRGDRVSPTAADELPPRTGQMELFLSLPYPIAPGDVFTVYPGCDKSRACCTLLFNNIINMFATPDVPGEDELYKYPDSKA